MADNVALLQQLGFGSYEARAYLALLQRSPLNGYELAKASGVPRSNIYTVLQKLEERGAVVRLDTPSGARYTPIPPQELIQQLGNRFQKTLDVAQRSLEALVTPAEPEYVWNLRGYTALLEHGQLLIDAAKEQLLVAIVRQEASALADPLAQAEARGVEIVTLCLDECPEECGSCRGTICRYCAALAADQRWLVLVADNAEVLAGEIGSYDDVLAVRTRQRLQVDLAGWYIRHSMTLTAVLSELRSRQNHVLEPETQALLRSVDPSTWRGGWLDHMRTLLQRGTS
jgi:HTH-type transcriptional regulator, sugar sensing transcriptional regulator